MKIICGVDNCYWNGFAHGCLYDEGDLKINGQGECISFEDEQIYYPEG